MIRPLADNVVVKPELNNRVTASGIVLPDLGTGRFRGEHNSEFGESVIPARVIAVGGGGFGYNGPADKDYHEKRFMFFEGADVTEGERVLIRSSSGERVIEGDNVSLGVTGEEPGTELRVLRAEEILAVLEETEPFENAT